MSKNYVCLDLYDDKDYKCEVQYGYVNDIDIQVESDDKQINVRLHREQAYILLQKLKNQFDIKL